MFIKNKLGKRKKGKKKRTHGTLKKKHIPLLFILYTTSSILNSSLSVKLKNLSNIMALWAQHDN